MSGVRTELAIENPPSCPLAEVADSIDGSITDVTWAGPADGTITEQFTAPADVDADGCETVFDYGSRRVYEFERDAEVTCVCEYIQQALTPVTSVYARDGKLYVTLHASDVDTLRDLVAGLSERYGDVSMEYLVRSREPGDDGDVVPVDLDRLTERQREVVETAYEMGYFEYPRGANAEEVAEELGIGPSTLAEHLATAQAKLLDEILSPDQ